MIIKKLTIKNKMLNRQSKAFRAKNKNITLNSDLDHVSTPNKTVKVG